MNQVRRRSPHGSLEKYIDIEHNKMVLRRRRPARKVMKKRMYKKRVGRSQAGYATRGYRTFTETLDGGTLLGNTGGIFSAQMNSIGQVSQYSALYQEFTIKKLEVLLLPQWNGEDENSQLYNAAVGVNWVGAPRIAFAVQESANNVAPASEIDVLACNGAQVRMLTKPTKLYSRKPVPILAQTSIGGLPVFGHTSATQWLSFDGIQNLQTQFVGIKYWITQPTIGGVTVPCNAYYKITFAVRDPR